MEELYFKNYIKLCEYFGLKCTSGKSRTCQLNKLRKTYTMTKKGNSFILKQKDNAILPNKKELTTREEKITDLLLNPQRNSYYFKNNFMIYMYELKKSPNNIYSVYNIQQMRDFGFLRKDIKPIYAYNTFIYQDPTYRLDKNFEDKLEELLAQSPSGKKVMEVVGEVYRTLYNRYTKIMNSTLYSLVSANKYFDVSTIYSQGEWLKFKTHFKRSLNILSKEIKLIGIPIDSSTEFILEDDKLFEYLDIRNQVFEESGFAQEDYETGLKMRGAIYSRIQERCRKELGIEVVYKKLYYGLISNLDEFHITKEQYDEARKLNNERMKNTLINYFAKKCGKDEILAEAYKEAVLYIADIND